MTPPDDTGAGVRPARAPGGRRLTEHRLFWPAAVLAALLLGNVALTHDFFAVRVQNGHLYGSLIDILQFGAP